MRQIVLDTETTGLEPEQGHRLIEIGAVELINRRRSGNTFHQYLNPEREVDQGALQVHGLSNAMLADKPRFADVAEELLRFLAGAELIIHNAPFDLGFFAAELARLEGSAGVRRLEECCTVLDTLQYARKRRPGQKNDLDTLCRVYHIDNSSRTLHGALLDAEILSDVYLAMTGGQAALFQESAETATPGQVSSEIRRLSPERPPLRILRASAEERAAHQAWMAEIDGKTKDGCLWLQGE